MCACVCGSGLTHDARVNGCVCVQWGASEDVWLAVAHKKHPKLRWKGLLLLLMSKNMFGSIPGMSTEGCFGFQQKTDDRTTMSWDGTDCEEVCATTPCATLDTA